MRTAVLALALFAAPAAYAQTVKDYVQVEGTYTNKLTGIGVVLGLNGNGDSPKGVSAQKLLNLLQHFSQSTGTSPTEIINAKNAALVMVTAELPPFAKKGTTINIRIAAMGDAKSLSGGQLMVTDMRSILGAEDKVYAMASGDVVLQGTARTGNPTAGYIPNGAQVFVEIKHDYVKNFTYRSKDFGDEIIQGKIFRLSLRKGDLTIASELAAKINEKAVVNPKNSAHRMAVARAIDGGTIEVLIPTKREYELYYGRNTYPEPGYIDDPVSWIQRILDMNVKLASVPTATVTINDVTKAVVWTDGVRVLRGQVTLSNGTVLTISDPEMSLTDAQKLWSKAIQGQDLIDAIRALESAGLLVGKVESK